MAVKTKGFVSEGGRKIRAIKVTEKNYLSVAEWASTDEHPAIAVVYVNKHGEESQHRVKVRTPKGIRVARVGDWVFKNLDDNRFYVISNEILEQKYTFVPPVPRKQK